MKPYIDTQERGQSANIKLPPTNNTNWGVLQTSTSSNMEQWLQGFMSRQEVSDEATTSAVADQTTNPGAADPNYRIPKISGRKSLQSNKLNQLALNIPGVLSRLLPTLLRRHPQKFPLKL